MAKTFLFSQINSLGCFLPFPKNSLNGISTVIESFIKGKLKISTARLYQQKQDGGLEIFNLSDFLSSQSVAWVKRAASGSEFWKTVLKNAGFGNVYNIRKHRLNKKTNPILFHIAECYEKFLYKFGTMNENYKKMFLFENPIFTFEGGQKRLLTSEFFPAELFNENKVLITNLTCEHFLGPNGNFITQHDFRINTGLLLSREKFLSLKRLVNGSRIKYSKHVQAEKKSMSVREFVEKIKKGSRKIRKIITHEDVLQISSNITKFANIIDTVINLEGSKKLNAQWGQPFLYNSTKTFLFKLHNNQLGTNTRVAHFVRGHERNCTFCTLNNVLEDNPETIIHLFYDCPFTESLLEGFFSFVFNLQNRNVTRTEFFVGFNLEDPNDNFFLDIANIFIKQLIWDCKLRYHTTSVNEAKELFIIEIGRIKSISRSATKKLNRSNLALANPSFNF